MSDKKTNKSDQQLDERGQGGEIHQRVENGQVLTTAQ